MMSHCDDVQHRGQDHQLKQDSGLRILTRHEISRVFRGPLLERTHGQSRNSKARKEHRGDYVIQLYTVKEELEEYHRR